MEQVSGSNQMKSMMKGSYDDHRLDKSNELNESMTMNQKSRDEYEQKIHNVQWGNE